MKTIIHMNNTQILYQYHNQSWMEYKIKSYNKITSFFYNFFMVYSYLLCKTADRGLSFRDITTLLRSQN
jgi:hypothetical protein